MPSYLTYLGEAHCGDSRELLKYLPDESVNLVITSPPFALQRKKDYGNESQEDYVKWISSFAEIVYEKLTEDGSFVLDLGGAYRKGVPTRSLYNFRVPIKFCDELGFFLAEDFYWYNPAKLPGPIEWVNKRKIRAKDAVNTVWWFSKTEFPKADVSRVLVEYGDRMKTLLDDPTSFYTPATRPSGHEISAQFSRPGKGAIPSNLLRIPNTDSNSMYLRFCRDVGAKPHPARFPPKLPEFFIKFLTEPGDVVVDIFSGSNVTGRAAESLGRRWISFESDLEYVATSAFRFLEKTTAADIKKDVYEKIRSGRLVNLKDHLAHQPLL